MSDAWDPDRWEIATEVGESFLPPSAIVVVLVLVADLVVAVELVVDEFLLLDWTCVVRWDNTLIGSTKCITWKASDGNQQRRYHVMI